jgi:chemotaxis protein methyltransferase CheR
MARESDEREFQFTSADFERIRKLLYDHSGISLNPQKKDMVYSRLSRRLRALGLKTFDQYVDVVEGDHDNEWETFVNSLTTNLTSFFREEHHFPILADLLRRTRKRPIRLWCSAASTGEEPYTIAMTVVDTFGTLNPPVEIIATDIDTNVLNKAQAGVYALDTISKLPADLRKRFFLKGQGAHEGKVKIRRELVSLISFRQLNLLGPSWPVNGVFDAIFCRNVMIYFDKETQYKILKRFVPLMDPDGLLFAGHSESLYHANDLFKLRGKSVYQLSDVARAARMREVGGAFGLVPTEKHHG